MPSAERERLVQMHGVGGSRNAALICAGCLALLALVVVQGSSRVDEYAQLPRPAVIAAATSTPLLGARPE